MSKDVIYVMPFKMWIKKRHDCLVTAIHLCEKNGRKVPERWAYELRVIKEELKEAGVKL